MSHQLGNTSKSRLKENLYPQQRVAREDDTRRSTDDRYITLATRHMLMAQPPSHHHTPHYTLSQYYIHYSRGGVVAPRH